MLVSKQPIADAVEDAGEVYRSPLPVRLSVSSAFRCASINSVD
jgi:hypothetical protein